MLLLCPFKLHSSSFSLSNVGSILNGGAGVVACVCPSVISALWFPPGQRTTATGSGVIIMHGIHAINLLSHKGLSWVMLELGNAVGFLLGPLLVPDPPAQPWPNATQQEYHGSRMQMREDIMILMYTRNLSLPCCTKWVKSLTLMCPRFRCCHGASHTHRDLFPSKSTFPSHAVAKLVFS